MSTPYEPLSKQLISVLEGTNPHNMGPQPRAVKEVPKRAFLAFTLPQVELLMPAKKLCDQGLTWEQHVANQALTQRWGWIEHVHSSVKRCHIVKDWIRRGRRRRAYAIW